MRVKVLASGSRGNCTLVQTESTNILIDVGILCSKVDEYLQKEKINLKTDIAGIIITHGHSDHVKGLEVLMKKVSCPVYVPKGLEVQLRKKIPAEKIRPIDDAFTIESLEILPFPTSHDAYPSCGYILTSEEKSLVYVTDTGYINERLFPKLKNKSMYIMESNHDIVMLMNGPYPEYLKFRVQSDSGHLSNAQAGEYLTQIVGESTKHIILAHLSEKNNTEEVAYQTVFSQLEEAHLADKELILARQDEATEFIEV